MKEQNGQIDRAKVRGEAPHAPSETQVWGSDPIADMLRALGFEYIALTPGASFRGLHDSLVNHLGNERPEMLLCIHEEHAVAIAHGYAKVTGRPMAVVLHSNVGLMHATMAIFNAWCDRVPIMLLGAVGPLDAVRRRPWVDWIHTASDLGALVRGYTKWDDQPGSVAAALDSLMRAHRIALTQPGGPVYVCLDAGLQEQRLEAAPALPEVARFAPAPAGEPSRERVAHAVELLSRARRPLIMMGRLSPKQDDWDRRIALAERIGATVLTDMKTGAVFPTEHALHRHPAGIFLDESAYQAIREADVVLSLEWIDLGGSLRQACGGRWPDAKVIHCSLDEYVHNGWSMDYQALPPADVPILASADCLVSRLLEALGPGRPLAAPAQAAVTSPAEDGGAAKSERLPIATLARIASEGLAAERPSYIRLPIGWPGQYCRFTSPLDFIGYDGGGGIGSGPGMAVGAALALRGSGRLPVAVLGDGDYLMGVTALWTAVHYRIPLLILVANNQSFFNDELHQERVARLRDRPIENRWIGMRMSDPPMNLATLAAGQGALGFGPLSDEGDLEEALGKAIEAVKGGAVAVVDVAVAPEYARATSSAVVREMLEPRR